MSYKLPLFAAAAFLGGYMIISNRQLRVNKYELKVSKLPENFIGKKILLLADLHKKRYGDNFNNLVNSCIAAEPDFIFFAGDLYSRDETDMIPKLALMKRLKHIAPTYYIFGNHETDNMDNAEALALKLTECGVHVLRNNMEQIKIGEDHINIYGTQLPQRFYRNEDFSHHDLPQITKDELTKLLGEPDRSECNFLLSHTPLAFRAYADWGADVTFSGHCHGGVIRLPFIGGILSPERKFFPRYTKGIYELNAEQGLAKLAVTAGLGKFRLNNPSEIMICTLERQE